MIATSKEAPTVRAGGASAVARQHDIGMGLFPALGPGYHVAANALLPLVWYGAGNKAEFGSSSVKVPTGRIAVSLDPSGVTLQLDCYEPAPMPGSVCFACTNTVVAGFTLADCFAGFAAMIVDSAAVFIVNFVAGKLVGLALAGVGALVVGILSEVSGGITVMLGIGVVLASPVGVAAAAAAATVLVPVAEMLTGWVIGSPLGYSYDYPWTGWGGSLNNIINDLISPDPTLPAPPAPAPAPGSSGVSGSGVSGARGASDAGASDAGAPDVSSGTGGQGPTDEGDSTPSDPTWREGGSTPADPTGQEGGSTPADPTGQEGGFTPADSSGEDNDFTPSDPSSSSSKP